MTMLTRRQALGAMAAPAAAATMGAFAAPQLNSSPALLKLLASHPGEPDDVAHDEDFWARVAEAFTVDRSFINLNNGGVSPAPAMVQDQMKRHLDYSNTSPPPIALWQVLEPQKEHVRQRLARHWGVDAEEIALTRNASESLQICQFGFDLKSGDEVLTTDQDYPRMINTFRQREQREGIKMRQFSIPVPAEDEEEIVRRFESNITPKTKLILMSHMINLTGQILPAKKIVAMARRHDIPVIVDGAHALAHFDFKLADLDCDYYATSLHKWLFAPHGTGLLYVRRNRIKNLWPLMAAPEEKEDDIRKFEEIGTHPAANGLAVAEALTFHQHLGDARKAARLRHLRDYWAKPLLEYSDRVRLHTSFDPRYSCGIATVEIEGIEPGDLVGWLHTTYNVITTPIAHDQFEGVRVSPSVYTTLHELDRFIDAMKRAIDIGIN